MLKQILFETRIGEWILTLLEKTTGLALVTVEWLGVQGSGIPLDSHDMTVRSDPSKADSEEHQRGA